MLLTIDIGNSNIIFGIFKILKLCPDLLSLGINNDQ